MAAIFTFPLSQSLRFVNLNNPEALQNHDNRFADRMKYPNALPYHYTQRFLNTDPLWITFRTNYETFNFYLVGSDNVRNDITGNVQLLTTDSSGRNYYLLPLDLSLLDGCYFIEATGQDVDKPTVTFQSDKFEVTDYLEDTILIEWYGNDSYDDKIHWVDLRQFLRLNGDIEKLSPEQSKSIYDNSDYAPITLKSKPIRLATMYINKVPDWIMEKVNAALSHDEFYVNNVQYNTDELIEVTRLGNTQLQSISITLSQLNFENGEDEEITGGEILQSYLKINDTDYLLINDAGDMLKINN